MKKFIIDTNATISASELSQLTELFKLGIRPNTGDIMHTHKASYIVNELVFDLPKNRIILMLDKAPEVMA